jgi:hypothetical protein
MTRHSCIQQQNEKDDDVRRRVVDRTCAFQHFANPIGNPIINQPPVDQRIRNSGGIIGNKRQYLQQPTNHNHTLNHKSFSTYCRIIRMLASEKQQELAVMAHGFEHVWS